MNLIVILAHLSRPGTSSSRLGFYSFNPSAHFFLCPSPTSPTSPLLLPFEVTSQSARRQNDEGSHHEHRPPTSDLARYRCLIGCLFAPGLLYPGGTSQGGHLVLPACSPAPDSHLRSPGALYIMDVWAGGVAHRIDYRHILRRTVEQHDHLPLIFPPPTPFPRASAR